MIPKLLKSNHWMPKYCNFKNFKFLMAKIYENLRNFTQITKVYVGCVILRKFTPKKIS